jgi:hypothetical protein
MQADISKIRNISGINPSLLLTKYQQNLYKSGVNPNVYFAALKALFLDYDFDEETSVSILNKVLSKQPGDAKAYFDRLVFTIGRKVGLNFKNTVNDMMLLEFTHNGPDYSAINKSPPKVYTPNAYLPKGIISFTDHAQVAFPYDETWDANLIIDDPRSMGGMKVIHRNNLKMVVVDLVARTQSTSDLIKKVRRTVGKNFQRLFKNDNVSSTKGIYPVSEWTPLMIANRESRVKWIIHKELRNWRVVAVAKKRKSLMEAGYALVEYAVDDAGDLTKDVDASKAFEESIFTNWLREKAVRMFDVSVLAPVFRGSDREVRQGQSHKLSNHHRRDCALHHGIPR